MNSTDLAAALELMAQALRHMPAAAAAPSAPAAAALPQLHRTLAEWLDVQTLLGHKHAEMTDIYKDDRGLSAHVWKRVEVPSQTTPA